MDRAQAWARKSVTRAQAKKNNRQKTTINSFPSTHIFLNISNII